MCALFSPLLRAGHRSGARRHPILLASGRKGRFLEVVVGRKPYCWDRLQKPTLAIFEVADVTMEAPEAERRVEVSAPVERQRRLIEQLERGGNDVTSAKIMFDSLRVSLSFYVHVAAYVFGVLRHDKAPVVPDEIVQEKTDDQLGDFAFCPLTEEEKKEFTDSLDAKGRTTLADLMGKENSSEPVAANQNLKSAQLSGLQRL